MTQGHFFLGFKLLHVGAVILFLGNITTGVFWKAHADRTRDPRLIGHAIAGIIRSDRIFTIPSIFLVLIGGIGAAVTGLYPILRTGWIFWSLVLFSISGLAYSRVAPAQRRMLHVARAGEEPGQMDWKRYESLSRSWALWGGIALAAPAIAAALMIVKPILPGLRAFIHPGV